MGTDDQQNGLILHIDENTNSCNREVNQAETGE